MKKLIISLILILSLNPAKAVDLGPFDVTVDFCKNVNKVGSILNAFQITQWPVVGMPGIVIGLSQRTSPVVDLCNYIMQVRMADTAEAALLTAEKLNDLTNKKWDDQLQLSKATFKLANSVYNFNSGRTRKGSLNEMNIATSMGNFIVKTKNIMERREARLKKEEDKRQSDEQIQKLAKAARERAIIKEATTCPDSKNNPDYVNVYKNEYKDPVDKSKLYEKQAEYIKNALQDLGTNFVRNYEDYRQYTRLLNDVVVTGVKYDFSYKDKKETSKVKTGQIDSSTGEATTTDTVVNNRAQVWTVSVREIPFDRLVNRYSGKYQDYAYNIFYFTPNSGMVEREILPLKEQIENIYKDVVCSEATLMKNEDPAAPEYAQRFIEKSEDCKKSDAVKLDRKKGLSLFSFFVDQLRDSLLKSKTATAKIWSLDSWYLGKNRVVSQDFTEELSQETVQCSQQLSVADMQLLGLKAQSANNEYSEIVAENAVKQSVLADAEMERKKDEEEEVRAKKALAERDRAQNSAALKSMKSSTKFEAEGLVGE